MLQPILLDTPFQPDDHSSKVRLLCGSGGELGVVVLGLCEHVAQDVGGTQGMNVDGSVSIHAPIVLLNDVSTDCGPCCRSGALDCLGVGLEQLATNAQDDDAVLGEYVRYWVPPPRVHQLDLGMVGDHEFAVGYDHQPCPGDRRLAPLAGEDCHF